MLHLLHSEQDQLDMDGCVKYKCMKIYEIYNTDENIGPAPKGVCSKPMSSLPASWVSSCKSQGKMKRTGNRSEKVGRKTMKVSGKRIKGKKYGGPLPDYSK